MYIIDRVNKTSKQIKPVTFSSLGLKERDDLQDNHIFRIKWFFFCMLCFCICKTQPFHVKTLKKASITFAGLSSDTLSSRPSSVFNIYFLLVHIFIFAYLVLVLKMLCFKCLSTFLNIKF